MTAIDQQNDTPDLFIPGELCFPVVFALLAWIVLMLNDAAPKEPTLTHYQVMKRAIDYALGANKR